MTQQDFIKKQTPKKVEIWNNNYSCPSCKRLFSPTDLITSCYIGQHKSCSCGQALDWDKVKLEWRIKIMKKTDLDTLKVGDKVYTLKPANLGWDKFRYAYLSEETITKITPKRTKFTTNKGEYTQCNQPCLNPFVIPDEELKRQDKIARCFIKVVCLVDTLYRESISKYSDEELLTLAELVQPISDIITTHSKNNGLNKK
jgi:hypothetical protein